MSLIWPETDTIICAQMYCSDITIASISTYKDEHLIRLKLGQTEAHASESADLFTPSLMGNQEDGSWSIDKKGFEIMILFTFFSKGGLREEYNKMQKGGLWSQYGGGLAQTTPLLQNSIVLRIYIHTYLYQTPKPKLVQLLLLPSFKYQLFKKKKKKKKKSFLMLFLKTRGCLC